MERTTMALYMIERSFAAALNPTVSDIQTIGAVNASAGVRWVHSLLSADKRKTYCLYEANDADAVRDAAERAGLPADVIVEIAGELRPEAFAPSASVL
jgi:Protein of unknown function (DUF4242)